jgi:hypothetical protein
LARNKAHREEEELESSRLFVYAFTTDNFIMSIDLFRCESNKYFGIVSLDSIAFIHHKGNGVNIFISSQAESHKGFWGVNSLGDLRFRESAFVFAAAQKPSGRDNEQIINLL